MNNTEKLQIAVKALTTIRDDCGAVCPEFEICTHPWCNSSAGAVLIALETLEILAKDCIECVKKPTLSVTVIVGNTTMHVSSCQEHPLDRGRQEIVRNNLTQEADTNGYRLVYEPL